MNAANHQSFYDEISQEIVELEATLAELKAVAAWHKARLSRGKAEKGSQKPASQSRQEKQHKSGNANAKTPTIGEFSRLKQVEAAEKVLRVSQSSMKTADIATAMIEKGFPQKDQKKLTISLFTSMLRKPQIFRKVGSGLWALTG